MDLGTDPRTAVSARVGGSLPWWTAERLLPRLAAHEQVDLVCQVAVQGTIQVLAVTTGRVLLVTDPRATLGPALVRDSVFGTVSSGSGGPQSFLTDGHVQVTFDHLPVEHLQAVCGLLPQVRRMAGLSVSAPPPAPTRRAKPLEPSGRTIPAAEKARKASTTDSVPRRRPRVGGSQASAGSDPVVAPPAKVVALPAPAATAEGPVYRLVLSQPVFSWLDAEALAATLLGALGFHNARVTPAGPDAGIDAEADGAVAQAKYQQQAVGAPVVQALYGVAQSRQAQGVFLSHSRFTPAALRFAEGTGVALYVYDEQGTVTAKNKQAEELVRAAKDRDADWASRARFARERKHAEQISAEVQALLGQVQWLTAVVADRQRRDFTRKGLKAQRKATDEISKALQDLTKVEQSTGWQRKSHLSSAKAHLKSGAAQVGVKLPR